MNKVLHHKVFCRIKVKQSLIKICLSFSNKQRANNFSFFNKVPWAIGKSIIFPEVSDLTNTFLSALVKPLTTISLKIFCFLINNPYYCIFFFNQSWRGGSWTNNPDTIHMIAKPIKIDAHSKLDLLEALKRYSLNNSLSFIWRRRAIISRKTYKYFFLFSNLIFCFSWKGLNQGFSS